MPFFPLWARQPGRWSHTNKNVALSTWKSHSKQLWFLKLGLSSSANMPTFPIGLIFTSHWRIKTYGYLGSHFYPLLTHIPFTSPIYLYMNQRWEIWVQMTFSNMLGRSFYCATHQVNWHQCWKLECLSQLEQGMFEVSAQADIAGNYQWGLDAGHHQDNCDPYSGLQWLCNKVDHSFGDDKSYIQVRNIMSTFCCATSLH